MKKLTYYLLLLLCACELEDRDNLTVSDVLHFDENQKKKVIANGQSSIPVTVLLGKHGGPDQVIRFTTDQGSFQGAGASDNDQQIEKKTSLGEVTVYLISDVNPKDSVAVVAKVGDFSIQQNISFATSYPSNLYITSDKLVLTANRADFSTFTVTLIKEPGEGKVSNGTIVDIDVETLEGDVVTDVVPFVKANNETATFTIKSANDKPGKVLVTVTTPTGMDEEDEPISAIREIEFVLED